VATEAQLKECADHLSSVTEIAIDLEHHSVRTYLGLTCLIQISTRKRDFIIDTLALRPLLSQYLLACFTDPKTVKVLHGADMDIQWLQRDCGLYIINMFDTGQASRCLQLQSFGLKFLLQSICNVEVDKKYQLADWRLRPLPAEMLKYARQDTHYLLYIYDCLVK
jgi:exosome complex exonuclease RRP6